MSGETATSIEVLQYYERNWEQIVRCYDIGPDGLPVDPAFHRRRIYVRFLAETGADDILDVGCGGGRTVLDALQMGRRVKGIEPVAPLVDSARSLLAHHGFDPSLIYHGDMAEVQEWAPRQFGMVAALSILPHVDRDRWDVTHDYLVKLVADGGYFVASYRNDLFDLYTFNSFTVDFFMNSLWSCVPCRRMGREHLLAGLKGLLTNPDVPGPYYTAAEDKSFGRLTRVGSNPLEIPTYISRFGLTLVKTFFYNFHCVPPLLKDATPDFRAISHEMDMEMSEDWRGHFMASTFAVLAQKVGPGAR